MGDLGSARSYSSHLEYGAKHTRNCVTSRHYHECVLAYSPSAFALYDCSANAVPPQFNCVGYMTSDYRVAVS